MTFHIADSVIDFMMEVDLKVGKQIQKAIKLIQADPTNPSLRRHKLARTPSKDLVSYSPNKDVRIVCLEPNGQDFYLLHANHHDLAYRWAQTRKVSVDSITGGVQIISLVEKVVSEEKPGGDSPVTDGQKDWTAELPPRRTGDAYLFDFYTNEELASLGVTARFTELVRRIQTEDDLVALMASIPSSLVDILVDMIPGGANIAPDEREAGKVAALEEVREGVTFSTFSDDASLSIWIEDLEGALTMPFERWKTYLHPAQRKAVARNSAGPLRISGGAGTGKTVVGLHRIKHLLEQGFDQVTIITYNRTLAGCLTQLITNLYGDKYGGKIRASSFHDFLGDVIKKQGVSVRGGEVTETEFLKPATARFPIEKLATAWSEELVHFVYREIVDIIAPQRIRTEAEYIKAPRPGRSRPLNLPKKKELWRIYEMCWILAKESGVLPYELMSHLALECGVPKIHDHALIVDEVQDLGPADLAALAECAPDANQLTLLEDRKQRIYGRGYSLKKLGINIVGKRSVALYVNYRTTEQIAMAAARNLPEDEQNAIGLAKSVRTGEAPVNKSFKNKKDLFSWLVGELLEISNEKRSAVITRYRKDLQQLESMLQDAGIPYLPMFRTKEFQSVAGVTLTTMHSAKGLEFEDVYFLDFGKSGHHGKSETMDEFELADADRRERHLRYVAFSRARDRLVVLEVGGPY